MKKALLSLLVGLSLISYAQTPKEMAATGIIFQEDPEFTKALEQSKKEGKLLFLDCYAVWCGPCKMLSKEIFTQKEVGDIYNSKFICIKYDMDKPEGTKIKEKYSINGYPTLLFIDAKGEIIHKSVGSGSVQHFVELASIATDDTRNTKANYTKLKNGDHSFETINACLELGPADKDSLLKLVYSNFNDTALYKGDALKLFLRYDNNLSSKFFTSIIAHRKIADEKIGADQVSSKLCNAFAEIIYKNGNNSEANAKLKEIDPKTYSSVMIGIEFDRAYGYFMGNRTDEKAWKEAISKATLYLSFPETPKSLLNNVSWTIFENYKTFNDTTTLKLSLNWAKRAYEKDSKTSYIADTYGHILYELGHYKEAVVIAEEALKYGEVEKSEYLNYYKESLELYKKKL